MAKVKLTRAHNGKQAGETIEIPDEQLNYYKSVKLIEDGKAPVSEQTGEKPAGKQGRKPKSN